MTTSPCKSSEPSAEQQACYYHHCCSSLHWLRIAAQQAYLPAHTLPVCCPLLACLRLITIHLAYVLNLETAEGAACCYAFSCERASLKDCNQDAVQHSQCLLCLLYLLLAAGGSFLVNMRPCVDLS